MTISKEMELAAVVDMEAAKMAETVSTDRVRDVMELAISGRSALAKAMLDDLASRRDSYNRTKAHLEAKEEEENRMPFWMWCVLWMNIGILLTLAFEKAGTEALLWLVDYVKASGGLF